MEGRDAAFVELPFVGGFADISVVLAVAEHAEDVDRELPSSREDCDGATFVPGLFSEEGAESGLGAVKGQGSHSEDCGDANLFQMRFQVDF